MSKKIFNIIDKFVIERIGKDWKFINATEVEHGGGGCSVIQGTTK